MNFRELEKIIKADGWQLQRTKGSHCQYTHHAKPGTVTLPFRRGDLPPKTVNSVLKQVGLKLETT
jgi:predicted RNA binding protein YcfA (HicA-like mRNA interferase family)